MLPRALVLSPDETVLRLLQEALSGFDCEVRLCKEIFSAVEAVTGQAFQVLLIDCQQQLEANFLLKTVRDLKYNRTVFAVAVGTLEQGREAMEAGADALLLKPFTAQQAAEMLLPRFGAEPPKEFHGRDSVPAEPASIQEPGTPAIGALETPTSSEPESHSQTPEWNNPDGEAISLPRPAPPPGYRGRSKFSPLLSITAIVWPLIIAAALLAFDQWPNLSHQGFVRFSGILASIEDRISTSPDFRVRPSDSNPGSADPTHQAGPPLGMNDDLLADYASPAAPSLAPPGQNFSLSKPEDIDLASVETLPPSTRLLAPVFTIEPAAPRLEIPNSLRFPPPAQSATWVSPKGDLINPDWPAPTVTLPETVSRALLERQVPPQYPEQALRADLNGIVVLQASIARDGTVRDLKLVSGYLILGRAAFAAVKQWRYKPYRRNGESVEVQTLITVDFKRPPRG